MTRSSESPTVSCPVCGEVRGRTIYEVDGIPAHSCVLYDTREEALDAAVARMRLELCERCGFMWNSAFEAGLIDYGQDYEDQQAYSARFDAFARSLARRLVRRHALQGKEVVEVGCGKGDFLALLCEAGMAGGTGVDPAYVPGRLPPGLESRLTFMAEPFSERHAPSGADLVCCRHTLEHISDPVPFLQAIATVAERLAGTVVFLEVPEAGRILDERAFWDLYHEHCSYFTDTSLRWACAAAGLRAEEVWRDFDDQYLLVEARTGAASADDDPFDLRERALRFREEHGRSIESWRRRMEDSSDRVVLWGSGSKAVAFLSTLGLRDRVEFVVDVNPFRQGRFLPTTGQRIVPPDLLRRYRPQRVIVMNPAYGDEIAGSLAELGVRAELSVLDGDPVGA